MQHGSSSLNWSTDAGTRGHARARDALRFLPKAQPVSPRDWVLQSAVPRLVRRVWQGPGKPNCTGVVVRACTVSAAVLAKPPRPVGSGPARRGSGCSADVPVHGTSARSPWPYPACPTTAPAVRDLVAGKTMDSKRPGSAKLSLDPMNGQRMQSAFYQSNMITQLVCRRAGWSGCPGSSPSHTVAAPVPDPPVKPAGWDGPVP